MSKKGNDIFQEGSKFSAEHQGYGSCSTKGLRRRLAENMRKIRETYKAATLGLLSPTENYLPREWLCDNYYLIDREGKGALNGLKNSDKLPFGDDGYPFIYSASLHLMSVSAAAGNDECKTFLSGIKSNYSFSNAELYAFRSVLAAAAIEKISEVCRGMYTCDGGSVETISGAVGTLRSVSAIDFFEYFHLLSDSEKLLEKDPAGVYPDMSEETKEYYRFCVSTAAKKKGQSEKEFVAEALSNAKKGGNEREKHIGAYILPEHKRTNGKVFVAVCLVFPLIAATFFAFLTGNLLVGFYILFPVGAIVRCVAEDMIKPFLKRKFICSMSPEKINKNGETVVVISCLITSSEQIKRLTKNLLRVHLSGENIKCGLLADFKECDSPEKPEDSHLISVLQKEISKLNHEFGKGFFAFVRKRSFAAAEGKYMGKERKRGAITEFVRYIKTSKESEFALITGDTQGIKNSKYLLTLDSDTELSINAVAEMTAVLEHPLNKVRIENERVTNGYGIAVPRLTTDISSSSKSFFSRVFAGSGGLHTYGGVGGDFYQDLFSEGLFTGKGLIDVDAYFRLIDGELPLNRILSHDIIESGVLKTCVVSDTEFSDSFPTTVKSWMSRLSRWMRGDYQNASFLKNKTENEKGEKGKSALGAFDRFKLLENIRRAVSPMYIFSFFLFALFVDFRYEVLLLILALISVSPGEVIGTVRGMLKPKRAFRRFITQTVTGFFGGVVRFATNLLMLPQLALISFTEGVKAFWRSCVSHKNMLEWVTAAEAEGSRKNGIIDYYLYMWFNVVSAIIFIIFGNIFLKILGVLWMLAPAILCEMSRSYSEEKYEFSEEDEEFLYSSAAAMWRFFEKYVGEESGYLPPDNVQYSPYRVAMRTSPTNIGLYLLCILSARDFGFIDSAELRERVLLSLKTIEKLSKWNGNLYNWYDLKTLEPLEPKYVSSVDSGNFLCSLTALKEGLREYLWEEPALKEAVEITEKLLRETDLSKLYNKRRRLFYIGYNESQQSYGENVYDILISEARMTSYYAIAKKTADKKHWGTLGRLFAGLDGYVGPLSWTGTMFEYYMPHLLIPVVKDSLTDEALKYALYCQKKRVASRKLPWGISESGFYAFDGVQNYQYKAFGVQKLGLKRGLDEELVISPYSTFLALPFSPEEAIKNLKKLINLGMNGEFGLYEAVDFTPSRVGRGFGIVKSYMAHHLGMSVLSLTNAIFDGVMQKRFMRDMDMNSAQKLLEEAVYDSVSLYKGVALPDVKFKGRKLYEADMVFVDADPFRPNATVLSNGEFSTVITDGGCGFSKWNGMNVNAHERDAAELPMGVFVLVKEEKNEAFSLTSAPYYDSAGRKSEFSSSSAVFSAVKEGLETVMGVCVHGRMPAEIRVIKIGNTEKRKKECEALIYTEPVLREESEHKAHPAFSDIFLMCEYMPAEKCLLVWRRGNDGEEGCVAYGFSDASIEFEFETVRSEILDKGAGIHSLKYAFEKEFSNRDGTPVIPCVALKTRFALKGGENKTFLLIQCVGKTRAEALSRFNAVRRQGIQSIMKTAWESSGSMAVGNGGVAENLILSRVIPRVFFNYSREDSIREAVDNNKLGKDGLWSMSISGDKAIVTYEMVDEHDAEKALNHIQAHRYAKLKGIEFDLCIVYSDGGEYDSKVRSVIREVLSKKCASGSVFFVDKLVCGEDKLNLLKSKSVYFEKGEYKEQEKTNKRTRFLISRSEPISDTENVEEFIPGGGFEKTGFITYPQKSKSPLPWCFPIANPTFGTLLSDSSLGFTFYMNSYLNRLTPWSNNYMRDNLGERLFIRCEGKYYELTKGAFVRFSAGCAEYKHKMEDLYVTVRVTLHKSLPVKRIRVTLRNNGFSKKEVDIAFFSLPLASMERGSVKIWSQKGAIYAKDPMNEAYRDILFSVWSNGKVKSVTDKESFFSGDWEGDGAGSQGDCAALISNVLLAAGEDVREEFFLSAGSEKSIAYSRGIFEKCDASDNTARGTAPAFRIKTPDEGLDRLVNFYLPYQTEISRVYSRTGFSQNSGAYGFRDQLQDVCAMVYSNPGLVRCHILKAASAQFEEGDVLHWWHKLPGREGGFRGVRTRCSDDLLWLPYATCFYVKTSEDVDILNEWVRFINGEKLGYAESERYIAPKTSCGGTLYEHCKRGIDCAYKQGKHGLLLIGSGDWNDGMNRVGIKNKGESVWLSMFALCVMREFQEIAVRVGDVEYAELLKKRCNELKSAVESNAWEDDRYIRGYHDDGSRLGSRVSKEAQIDSLPQSFSVFSGCNLARAETALSTALKKLVLREKNIVKLFDPPYSETEKEIGYIKAYPKGVRENGGQYTHAAVWLAKALFSIGKSEEGYEILKMISPITHGYDSAYKVEPYFIAADIYTASSCLGRGGWSIYTGAASWYYRVVIEDLLGIKKEGKRLKINPSVPGSWTAFEVEAELEGTILRIKGENTGRRVTFVNGEEWSDYIPLEGGELHLKVEF